MNEWLNNLVIMHVLKDPRVAAVAAVIITNIDRPIRFALKFFSVAQIEGALDKADAAAKAEVERVAKEQPPK